MTSASEARYLSYPPRYFQRTLNSEPWRELKRQPKMIHVGRQTVHALRSLGVHSNENVHRASRCLARQLAAISSNIVFCLAQTGCSGLNAP
jgi:hypothetical protein